MTTMPRMLGLAGARMLGTALAASAPRAIPGAGATTGLGASQYGMSGTQPGYPAHQSSVPSGQLNAPGMSGGTPAERPRRHR